MDAKPQLILVANKHEESHAHAQIQNHTSGSESKVESKDSDDRGFNDCSDILMTPKLVENGTYDNPNGNITHINKDINLTSIQQAVILAQCLHLQRRCRDDELSGKIFSISTLVC